jgi:oxygen-independent coproporphyrinogen-3 oxidase
MLNESSRFTGSFSIRIQHSTLNIQHSTGLYLHLPFCRVHCSYCPFAVSTRGELQDEYTAALLREIDERGNGEAVDTLFFGGGTPSRMSVANLTRIVDRLRERFAVDADAEFTLEANPEDVDAEAVAAWRALGVNRLSLGVQSFHDTELLAIDRAHDAARAREVLRVAVSSGLRVSLDIILGLPHQTAASFRSTLEEAIGSGAGHLSLYLLDLEERTALAVQVERGRVALPDDDLVAALYVEAVERLERAGLAQYEISNFGERCRHNLRYWHRREYLGFGMGAHSFLAERRFANTRDIGRYLAGERVPALDETLTAEEVRHELLFLRLRQVEGIESEEVARLCGQEGLEWIERGLSDGWLRRAGSRVAFTPTGFLLSNEHISRLF